MLYYFSHWFQGYYSFLNLFRYQTFRSGVAFFLSLAIVLVFQPRFIRWFRARWQLGQPIRDDGPQSHFSKKGTPTMGGLVLVVAVLVTTFLLAELWNRFVLVTILVTLVYGGLGFWDDYLKIQKKNSKGVSARTKLAWQFGTAVVALILLKVLGDGFSDEIIFPFTKQGTLDLGWLFIPFAACVVVGASNAVNLTDGLDGLVIGPTMTVAFAYGIFCYVAGNAVLAEYLQLPHVNGSGELAIFASAILAGGLGFLWYNSFPAQVFMGDVGALALGGALGMLAVITKQELIFVVAGGVFVVEALSVILQVASFKMTGKRIFKMAPIHHHFELLGLSEPKIIVRCWIISVVLAVISIISLKIR